MELLYALVGSILAGRAPTIFSLPSAKTNVAKYFESLPKLLANAGADLVITEPKLFDLLNQWNISFEAAAVMVDGEIRRAAHSRAEHPPVAPRGSKPPVILQYSSGTTGLRKGVALADDAILHQLDVYAGEIRLKEEDVIVSWLPLYHDMGLIACCLMPLAKGVPVVWMSPFEWVNDPVMWFQYVSKYRGTLAWLPNFSYNLCAARVTPDLMAGIDLSSVRCLVNCSEPVRPDSHRVFRDAFGPFGLNPDCMGASYALAENTFAVTEGGVMHPVVEEYVEPESFFKRSVAKPVTEEGRGGYWLCSSGRPIKGQEVKIVDEARRALPLRHVGEIALRGKCMLAGYFRNPEATNASIDAEGWFYTGDMGYLTEQSDLFVTGRKKDMIIVSGVNIYPTDIEYLVSEVPGVHPGRVVAFGVFNEEKGTEELVIVAEQEESWVGKEKEIERAVRRLVTMCAECPLSDIALVPPKWLLKSSSGKTARSANKEKYLAEKKRP